MRVLVTALVVCLLAGSALAIQPPREPGDLLTAWSLPRQDAGDAAWSRQRASASPAWSRFTTEAGGSWQVRWDRVTDRPALFFGSGLPVVPGRGNELSWSDVGLAGDPGRAATLDHLVQWSRQLLQRHPELLRVPARATLRRSSGTLLFERRPIAQVAFHVEVDGVPVSDALVVLRFHSGNLVQAGVSRVHESLSEAATTPVIAAASALERTLVTLEQVLGPSAHGPRETVEAGRLLLLPVAAESGGLDYRLAWDVRFRLEGAHPTWGALVDARTGELIRLRDENAHACETPPVPTGRVRGGVFLARLEEQAEQVRGMPHASAEQGGPLAVDRNGHFEGDAALAATGTLDGTYFSIECVDCPDASVTADTGLDLDLGFGGDDRMSNGFSTSAERSCYYHLNGVRSMAAKHLADGDTGGFLDAQLPARVNLDDDCNAFWNGTSVNFFTSGGGCNNTGLIADVMQHEWGHAIDQATRLRGAGTDRARGEGMSDVVAFLTTHDPNLGPYFRVGVPRGIRHADDAVSGLRTVSNIADFCPDGGGPLGRQVHCEGNIFSQVNWYLGELLRAKLGDHGGWYQLERLFYQSLPISDTYLPDETDSAYDAYVLIDDDDGDLANGTPNGTEILEAFERHETASTPSVGDSPDCVPPAAPVVTSEVVIEDGTRLVGVRLSWEPVPGVVEYVVSRSEIEGDTGHQLLAFLPPGTTEHVDPHLFDGLGYSYFVRALGADGCFSIEGEATTAGTARLTLVSLGSDDSVGWSNDNGRIEPGDLIALPTRLRCEIADAAHVEMRMTSGDPRLEVVVDQVVHGAMGAGDTRSTLSPFTVLVGRDVACGEFLPVDIELEVDGRCRTERHLLEVGEVVIENVLTRDFENPSGWTVDPDGTDDATTGIWVREDPNPTGPQPDDDVSEDGVRAWITGNDPAPGAGTDDIDDGCTTLLSSRFDMGGTAGLELAYWRFYHLVIVLDDALTVEISNDDGMSWDVLEQLTEGTGGWQDAVFDLDTVLGGPADVLRLRYTACDQGEPSQTEAGLDELRFRRPPRLECAPVVPPPAELQLVDAVVLDDGSGPGDVGNGNGWLDPGETARLVFTLENVSFGTASAISGEVSFVSAPAAAAGADTTTTWPDLARGESGPSGSDDPAHVAVTLPRPGVDCGELLEVMLRVTYTGEDGVEQVLEETVRFDIGQPRPGEEPLCEGARGCEVLPAPGPVGPVLRVTRTEAGEARLSWDGLPRLDEGSFVVDKGASPDRLDSRLTPPGHVDGFALDPENPSPLFCYRVRQADCDGVEGP
ncbi:MAG: hypothetical protein AAF533_21185 [Acidobacteriota bacterium]